MEASQTFSASQITGCEVCFENFDSPCSDICLEVVAKTSKKLKLLFLSDRYDTSNVDSMNEHTPLKLYCCSHPICYSCVRNIMSINNSVCPWCKRKWVNRSMLANCLRSTPLNYCEMLLQQQIADIESEFRCRQKGVEDAPDQESVGSGHSGVTSAADGNTVWVLDSSTSSAESDMSTDSVQPALESGCGRSCGVESGGGAATLLVASPVSKLTTQTREQQQQQLRRDEALARRLSQGGGGGARTGVSQVRTIADCFGLQADGAAATAGLMPYPSLQSSRAASSGSAAGTGVGVGAAGCGVLDGRLKRSYYSLFEPSSISTTAAGMNKANSDSVAACRTGAKPAAKRLSAPTSKSSVALSLEQGDCWECRFCTYKNSALLPYCEVCSFAKQS